MKIIKIESLKVFFLRNYFSYVPQENTLFPGLTLKENLELGNPNMSIPEMHEICKELDLHDKIQSLKSQYDTIVDASIPFSIGQLQRLSIARAVLGHKPFLILMNHSHHWMRIILKDYSLF